MAYEDDHFRPDTNTPTIHLGSSEDESIDLPPHLKLEPGDQVGHYHIISLVAEGGFGIVYLAEQHSPVRRRVALKIIKPGMDTVGVITRFEAERQALAILDHPGIATVYDAGATDDGRPFFVMEYVEGEPITDYCDDHRLDTMQRLHLMIEVCAAVQHAHMKGIIHRDLKPSNILVTTDVDGQPRPKVIDFGVAKATSMELTERSFCTETGQLIGTPEYMSPEQADLGSVDVDTRSDVYSLGMIIYELITGALPFESIQMRQAGFSELCRIIQEELPPKPSTRLISLGGEASKVATRRQTRPADLASMLRKELEWIPLKALRKEREERYESAVALADDIRRYIEGDVLLAGPETSAYRLRKFLRRNRGGVLAAAFVFITLLAGLNVSLVLLAETRRAQREATDQKVQLEKANEELQEAQTLYMELLSRAEDAEAESRARAEKMEQDLLYLQQATYTSNLHNARDALDAGDTRDARYRLRLASEGRAHERPFEWQYLWAQAEGSLALLASPDERLVRAMVTPTGDRVFTISPERFASWDSGAIHDNVQAEAMVSIATPNQDPATVILSPDGRTALLGHPNEERTLIETRQAKAIAKLPAVPEGRPPFVFSRDGRRVAHGLDGATLRVLDSRTARMIAEVPLPENVDRVVLDTTGSRIAAIERDQVHLINTSTGESVTPPLQHKLDVTTAAFDSSAIRLATTTISGQVRVWDVLTGRPIAEWTTPVHSIETIRFSPIGDMLHVQNKNDANALLDMRTGEVLAEPAGAWSMTEDWSTLVSSDDAHTLRIQSLGEEVSPRRVKVDSPTATALSNRGDLLVTADSSGNIHVWNLAEDPPQGLPVGHHESAIDHVSFADDDTRILAVSRDGPKLWSASGHQPVEELDLQEHMPTRLAFTPNLPWLVNGTRDGVILIIDLETGETIARLTGHEGEIVDLLHTEDGSRLVSTARDNTIRLWNLNTGEEMFSSEFSWWNEMPIALDSRTNLLVLPDGNNTLQLIDVTNGEIRVKLTGHGDAVSTLAFDSTGTRLATADNEGVIRLWRLDNSEIQARLPSHDETVTGLAFNGSGSRLLSASKDGTIRTWDAREGRELADLQIIVQVPIKAMALSPDDQQVAAGLDDGSIRTWSTATGDQLISLPTGMKEIQELAWSPRGDVLVAEGDDGSLRTWETTSWKLGADLAGSVADLDTRDINTDVDRIASVAGRNILLHDTRTGEFIFTLRDHDEEVTQLAFSSDGSRLISADGSGRLKIWNTASRSQGAARRHAQESTQERLKSLVAEWMERSNGDTMQLEDTLTRETSKRPHEEVHAIRALVLKQQQATGTALVN